MDVQCGVCATEYDLDDALLSDRGTVVRCTSCGHQFRVFPSESFAFAAERWVVFTRRGERLEYSSLRELQHALTTGYLGRTDELARGPGPRRPLGSIAELDGFYREAPGAKSAQGTLAGIAPAPNQPFHPAPPVQRPPLGAAAESRGGTVTGPLGSPYEARPQGYTEVRPTAVRGTASHSAVPGEFAATLPSAGGPPSPHLQTAATGWAVRQPGGDVLAAAQEALTSAQRPAWGGGADSLGIAATMRDLASPGTTQVSTSDESGSGASGAGSHGFAPPGSGQGGVPGLDHRSRGQLYSLPVPMSQPSPHALDAAAPEPSRIPQGGAVSQALQRGQAAGDAPRSRYPGASHRSSDALGAGGGTGSLQFAAKGTLRLTDSRAVRGEPLAPRQSTHFEEAAGLPEASAPRVDATMRSAMGDGGVGSAGGLGVSVSFVPSRDGGRDSGRSRRSRRSLVDALTTALGPLSARSGRDRSPFSIARTVPEVAPSGHRWMWFAIVALLPLLAGGGVMAWRYVQRARAERQVPTGVAVAREGVITAASVAALIEQGRLDEASHAIDRAAAGRPASEWDRLRLLLAVGRAELAHYRGAWDPESAAARGDAALALQKAEQAVTLVSSTSAAAQGVAEAQVRLAWIRSRPASPFGADPASFPVPTALADPFARVLAASVAAGSQPRALAGQLTELSRRELAFGPVRAASVAAWLEAGEVRGAATVLERVSTRYRDEAWHAAEKFVASRAAADDAGVSAASAASAAKPGRSIAPARDRTAGGNDRSGSRIDSGSRVEARRETAPAAPEVTRPPAESPSARIAPEPLAPSAEAGEGAPAELHAAVAPTEPEEPGPTLAEEPSRPSTETARSGTAVETGTEEGE